MFRHFQFHVLSDHGFARLFVAGPDGDYFLRTQPEPYIITAPAHFAICEHVLRRLVEPNHNFVTRYGQTLPGSDIKGYTGPTPGIDKQSHRREGFDLRVWIDACLVAVAAKLPTNNVRFRQRLNGA